MLLFMTVIEPLEPCLEHSLFRLVKSEFSVSTSDALRNSVVAKCVESLDEQLLFGLDFAKVHSAYTNLVIFESENDSCFQSSIKDALHLHDLFTVTLLYFNFSQNLVDESSLDIFLSPLNCIVGSFPKVDHEL